MKTIILSFVILLAGGIQALAQSNTIDFILTPGDTLVTAPVTAFTKNPAKTRFADAKEIQLRLGADSTLYFVDGQDSLAGDPLRGIEQVIGLGSNWGGDGPAVLLIKRRRGYNHQLLMLEIKRGEVGAINFGKIPNSLMGVDLNHLVIIFRDDYQMILMHDHLQSADQFHLVLQGQRLEGYCMH